MLAPFRYRGVTPYLIGIMGVALAAVLRQYFDQHLKDHLTFSFAYLAVAIAAWTGGIWPALVTAFFGSLVGNYYFTEPLQSLSISGAEELLDLLVFVAVSAVIGILSEISLRALARARHAEAEKDKFMAAVAHEMRSPLSVIYYASTLSRLGGSEQPNDQLDIIDRQVHHLNLMIEDLLDFSRIARGQIKLNRQLVNGVDIVAGAMERAKPMIDRHNHRVSVKNPSGEFRIFVDPARIEQVLTNLLTNAAKYTPDGGEIDVRLWAAGNQAIFSVCDNGIGIATDILPHVFDFFVQADSARDRSEGGLGIGLALARKIIELHGGTIEAASGGANRGSQFTVFLPLEKPAAKLALAQV